jgi:chromosome segregation ATPase
MLRQAVADSGCSFEEMDFGISEAAVAAAPQLRVKSSATEGPAQRTIEEEATARIVEQLGAGLAKVLMAGIRVLQQQMTSESRALSESVRRQQERLETTDKGLLDLKERIEQMVGSIIEQKSLGVEVHKQRQYLTAGVASLEEADKRQVSAVTVLRQETQELSCSLNERIESLLIRLRRQQEELSAMQSTVSEVTPRVAAALERLDHQTEAICAIQKLQVPWESAIDQLVETLTQLKSSPTPSTIRPDTKH